MKKVATNIFFVISLLVLIMSIVTMINSKRTNKEVFIFNHRPYIITSESMYPTLKINSLVIIRKTNYEDIKSDDIISFKIQGSNQTACHRVVKVTKEGIITKGDNNRRNDQELVTRENLVGKAVTHTNITSTIISKLSTVGGIIIYIVLPIIAITGLKVGFHYLAVSKAEKEQLDGKKRSKRKKE
jgi:signal peptidase I, archaeal type